jgi:serine protein kinase
VSGAPAFRDVHLDPHVLKLAAVFSVLTRLQKPDKEGLDLAKKLRIYAGESVEGFGENEAQRLRAEAPDEGLGGVSPRFIVNSISNAITRTMLQPHQHGVVAGAERFGGQRCAHDAAENNDYFLLARDFTTAGQGRRIGLFACLKRRQQLLEKYLDEVKAGSSRVTDPITGEPSC